MQKTWVGFCPGLSSQNEMESSPKPMAVEIASSKFTFDPTIIQLENSTSSPNWTLSLMMARFILTFRPIWTFRPAITWESSEPEPGIKREEPLIYSTSKPTHLSSSYRQRSTPKLWHSPLLETNRRTLNCWPQPVIQNSEEQRRNSLGTEVQQNFPICWCLDEERRTLLDSTSDGEMSRGNHRWMSGH